jgi:hypothetical protein
MKILIIVLMVSQVVSAAEIGIDWNPTNEPNVIGYRVHYCPKALFDMMMCGWISIDVKDRTSFTFKGLKAGEKYKLTVTAYDSFGLESDHAPVIEGMAK